MSKTLKRRACGQKLAHIGAVYDLSESQVSAISTGKVWAR